MLSYQVPRSACCEAAGFTDATELADLLREAGAIGVELGELVLDEIDEQRRGVIRVVGLVGTFEFAAEGSVE